MYSAGAHRVMLITPEKYSQPLFTSWSCKQLICECAIALGFSLFKLHSLPLDHTPDTFSFYMIFMSHHIKLASVMQYLSGIINSLKPHFPDIRANFHHILVT